MFRSLLVLVMTIVLVGAVVAAPTYQDSRPGLNDYLSGKSRSMLGLLDPSRMTIQHDIQMGVSFGGGSSLMQSLYASRIGYRLSDPLTLTFTIGMANTRFGYGPTYYNTNSLLGGAALDYRPTKDIFFHLEFMHGPGLYPSNAYFNSYGR
jgi:hypothetical protein